MGHKSKHTPQLWVRDPLQYLDAILEIPWATVRTVWTTEFLLETGLSPRKAMNVLVPGGNWEALALDAEGGYLMTGTDPGAKRIERWSYSTGDLKRLMELFVSGKRFIVDLPNIHTPKEERDEFAKHYYKFHQACPQAKPHIHGCVGYSKALGLPPYSVDFDLSHLPNRRSLQLPNGRLIRADELRDLKKGLHGREGDSTARHLYWINLLGYKSFGDIESFEDMVRFEMRSASWAVTNWEKPTDSRSKGIPRVEKPTIFTDEDVEKSYLERMSEMSGSDGVYEPKQRTGHNKWGWDRRKPLPTDRIACDTCSLADVCRAFRQGSVCAVPNTEGDSLAKKFGTRDSSSIISGLQELTKINVGRIEKALEHENDGWAHENSDGELRPRGLDPELTKLIDRTVIHGEKIAKLVDPRLRQSPQALVQVNNNSGGQPALTQASPQQLTATVVRELEAQGYNRSEITKEMISDHIKAISNMSAAGDFNDDEYVDAEVEE